MHSDKSLKIAAVIFRMPDNSSLWNIIKHNPFYYLYDLLMAAFSAPDYLQRKFMKLN